MTLFAKTIPYQTQSGGDYTTNKGKWTPGSAVQNTFQGSVQPISGKEIASLPVGRADIGLVKIYSSTPLPVSVQGGTESGAIISYLSQSWEVIFEMKFQNGIINHYKYIAEYRGQI